MILFILKKNETYGFNSYTRRSSGLWNSTRFIVEGLNNRGIDADITEVIDNNDIDRAVTEYQADIVVIEALWVIPSKFEVLKKLHPNVKWALHLHSNMPFLALEGIAMDWIRRCAHMGLQIIANSPESFAAILAYLPKENIIYLPNVYISQPLAPEKYESDRRGTINIGCFGALRPLKNQLMQALAAIKFAREEEKFLYFHINESRVETGGDPVLKNLVQLFEHQHHARLECHPWYEPDDFIPLLRTMDLGLQVSLTETFNVVSADYVTAGLPVVASKEVKWLSCWSKAKDDSVDDIVRLMRRALGNNCLVKHNQRLLLKHSAEAQNAWFEWSQA